MTEKINSGLVGWTSQAPSAPVSPPVPVPAPSANLPANFAQTSENIAKLARELAVNIRDPKDILREFGLTEQEFNEKIKPNPLFASTLAALIAEWNDAGNAPKRLRLQAQAILEDTMPNVGGRIANSREELKDVVSAFNAISKIAGMEGDKAPAQAGEKFTITINLGADTLKYDKITGTPKGTIEILEDKSNEKA